MERPHRRSKAGRPLAAIGIALLAGPVAAWIAGIWMAIQVFADIPPLQSEVEPYMARAIELRLQIGRAGLALGLLGAAMTMFVALRVKNREKWFFLGTVTLAFLWCFLNFPIGLLAGGSVLVVFLSRRGEFSSDRIPASSSG